jgi:hypothetical protein
LIVTLVLVVCLVTSPEECREEKPPIPDGVSCMVQAQQIAAEWIGDHPKWLLHGWRCRMGRPDKQT